METGQTLDCSLPRSVRLEFRIERIAQGVGPLLDSRAHSVILECECWINRSLLADSCECLARHAFPFPSVSMVGSSAMAANVNGYAVRRTHSAAC